MEKNAQELIIKAARKYDLFKISRNIADFKNHLQDILQNKFPNEEKFLFYCVELRIVEKIINASAEDLNFIIRQSIKRIVDDHEIPEGRARWAVETWALALNKITLAELAQIKNTPNKSNNNNDTHSTETHSSYWSVNPANEDAQSFDNSDFDLSIDDELSKTSAQLSSFYVIEDENDNARVTKTSYLNQDKNKNQESDTVGCVIGCLIIIIMIYVVFLAFRYVAGFFKTTTPKPSIPINAPKLPEPSQIKVPKPKTATSTPKKIDEKTSKVVSKPTTPTTQSPKTKSKPTPEPTYYPVNIDGLTIRFVDCPAGKFRMGVKNEDFTERKSEGKTVEFSRNFWIMETEVTQELWRKFETNPHGWSVKTGYGFKYPAYSIDWNMANNFAKKFEESLRLSGQLSPDLEINLPTEAQWEYACRAGTTAEFPFGNDGTKLDENAWFKKNASGQLHEVGKKAPNNWGVYDMLGNVAEWCADAWEDEIPGGIDPLIEGDAGSYRVLKGGSWNSNAELCNTDFRAKNQSTEKSNSYGFRLVINSKRNKKHVPKPTTIINNPEPSLKIPTKPKAAVVYEGSTKQILIGKSKLVFKWCPAGEFKMGNPAEDIQSQSIEAKQVNVKITKGFWMLDTEVTQDLWQLVMGANNDMDERIGKGDNYPVYNVSLVKAKKFCSELTRLLRKQNDINISQTVLIPTEAQWEYACRAGSGSTYCFGNNENELDDFAWFNLNSERKVHPVAEKKPNAWGLYDMHGNLAEFTLDKFSFNLPGGTDPYLGGDEKKDFFVIRGGHFSDGASRLRSAFRYNSNLFKASEPSSKVGFRVVLVE